MTEKDLIIQDLKQELKELKERDTPKKGKIVGLIVLGKYKAECPVCGTVYYENIKGDKGFEFCPKCGQRLERNDFRD